MQDAQVCRRAADWRSRKASFSLQPIQLYRHMAGKGSEADPRLATSQAQGTVQRKVRRRAADLEAVLSRGRRPGIVTNREGRKVERIDRNLNRLGYPGGERDALPSRQFAERLSGRVG